jgi:hypothetical protein
MGDRIAVTVTVDDKKVTLEGPEDFVRGEVRRLTDNLARAASSASGSQLSRTVEAGGAETLPLTEREFVAQKRPSGHPETVAVLAFFLRNAGQDEFSAHDVKRAYIRAGVRPPKVVAQALRDAKNNNDYLEPGSEKGTFRLTPHGERLVQFDLPRNVKA